jgi:predicted transposase YdaD
VDAKVKKLLGSQMQDYKVRIIEADKVEPECYRTDLREFFQALQWRNDKENLHRFIKSSEFQNLKVDAQLAIALHTGMTSIVKKVKEEKMPMCKAVEEWIEEERSIGRQEGIKEGEQNGRNSAIAEIIKRMLEAGMDETAILNITQCSKEELAAAQ